jgi:hypothetical protein
MEAMWINFESVKGTKFVIRPFLGGVNGISGEAPTGNMASLLRQMNSLTPKQDYVVLPDQKWLDGIATTPGERPTETPKANPSLMEMTPLYLKLRIMRTRKSEPLLNGKSLDKTRLVVSSYRSFHRSM